VRTFNDVIASARGINNAGHVVGDGSQGGWIRTPAGFALLSHVVTDAEWMITSATTINDRGQILAQAKNTRTGFIGAVRLDPP
jgi:hypothetical protein